MKVSVITATYNRADLLKTLYKSLLTNSNVEIDWLVMDDGSTDNTKEVIEQFQKDNKIEIKYNYQKNQGKMKAINELVQKATGDVIIDCDSDDCFTQDAFNIIKEEFEKNKNTKDIYGLCFLKQDLQGKNIGKMFKKANTTMFDLYFKEGEDGEKVVVFYSKIRKQFSHELENGEKFITEARMYHKMDEKYKMICINKSIMICDYKEDGYTKNIQKQFEESPYGYYKYFKEILKKDFKGVLFNKRLYAIKHYILFTYLTKSKFSTKDIRNFLNKLLYILLYIPGILKTEKQFKRKK